MGGSRKRVFPTKGIEPSGGMEEQTFFVENSEQGQFSSSATMVAYL